MALSNSSILRALDFCEIWVSFSPVCCACWQMRGADILPIRAPCLCSALENKRHDPRTRVPSLENGSFGHVALTRTTGLASVSAVHLRPCDGK
jgi:hypothetical protein